MLMRREPRNGGLPAEEFVELTLGPGGLLLIRLRLYGRRTQPFSSSVAPRPPPVRRPGTARGKVIRRCLLWIPFVRTHLLQSGPRGIRVGWSSIPTAA